MWHVQEVRALMGGALPDTKKVPARPAKSLRPRPETAYAGWRRGVIGVPGRLNQADIETWLDLS
jgi:hypothetical protein